MTILLAIDPGTTQSGWVEYDAERKVVLDCGVMQNEEMVRGLERPSRADRLAIEKIAGMGMAAGQTTFDTCVWIGRFQQAWRDPDDVRFVFRRDVKLFLCGSMKAKDANIRQALIDKFPPTGKGRVPQIGCKASPGPLYGVTSHAWSALAVAVTSLEAA